MIVLYRYARAVEPVVTASSGFLATAELFVGLVNARQASYHVACILFQTSLCKAHLHWCVWIGCRYLRSFSSSDQVKGRGGRVRCRSGFHCRGNYLVVIYILVKLLYLVNVVVQLFLLDMFLATPFHAYGIEVNALLVLVQRNHVEDSAVH